MIRLRLANYARTEFIDLMSGPLRIHSWGWPTKVSALKQNIRILPLGSGAGSAGYDPVVESISICSFGCESEIREAIANLETVLANAAAYNDDPLVWGSWWLEWLTKGEAGTGTAFSGKKSLILGGTWEPTARVGSWPMLTSSNILGQLIITRHPFWEDINFVDPPGSGAEQVSTVGGTISFTNTAGRVPARLETQFAPVAGATYTLDTIWAGFRAEYEGLTSFDPVWECESIVGAGAGDSAIVDAATTADTAHDVNYHNHYALVTTFGDTSFDERFSINVYAVLGATVTNAKHFIGRYLVLCRCWVDAGSAYIQMKYGYTNSTNPIVCDAVVIDNTDPQFREIGTIQIPPQGVTKYLDITKIDIDDQCALSGVRIFSQKVDADELYYDCLVLIPADYFAKLEDAAVGELFSTDYYTELLSLPNERRIAWSLDETDSIVSSSVSVSCQQWYKPIGDSVLVIAAQRNTDIQDVDDEIRVLPYHYSRWLSYRDT